MYSIASLKDRTGGVTDAHPICASAMCLPKGRAWSFGAPIARLHGVMGKTADRLLTSDPEAKGRERTSDRADTLAFRGVNRTVCRVREQSLQSVGDRL